MEEIDYVKPGDALPVKRPVLFLVEEGRQVNIEFAEPEKQFNLNNIRWADDSRSFTFDYNKRGHQEYIVYKVTGDNPKAQVLIGEKMPTFVYYNLLYRYDLKDRNEILWISERDGWRHLYLYDADNGQVKRQLTKGEWVVKRVLHVDDAARVVYLVGCGKDAGEDPYLEKVYRLNIENGELLCAKGRDGETDIWGVIVRPVDFDPSKKYPVIEYIYAGPHDSFVPKSFTVSPVDAALAQLGFIVVQIDGMGTANRSKKFHDVCWKNLKDGGFPDRIAWMKAAAAKYPEMDIDRVGIYGCSAGGQNAMGAVLFHPDFYKVSVAACGCHDNRMDKIWWNEQWMGYPVGKEYEACSNTVNAYRLQGKLMLILGELDDNVDPSTTFQVVNALIGAGKEFEFVVLPNQRHTMGGAYGERKRRDFFIRHLQGLQTPDWNKEEKK